MHIVLRLIYYGWSSPCSVSVRDDAGHYHKKQPINTIFTNKKVIRNISSYRNKIKSLRIHIRQQTKMFDNPVPLRWMWMCFLFLVPSTAQKVTCSQRWPTKSSFGLQETFEKLPQCQMLTLNMLDTFWKKFEQLSKI